MDIFERPLVQPDRRTCGAAALVVARMLRTPGYAEKALPRFTEEVLEAHRAVTRRRDARGRWQPPWPRSLGTPPWAMARTMSFIESVDYRVERVGLDRRAVLRGIATAVQAGHPVPLYVGSRRLPRHVVLVVGPGLRTYEPASGTVVEVDPADLASDFLNLAGWSRLWFAVLPASRSR